MKDTKLDYKIYHAYLVTPFIASDQLVKIPTEQCIGIAVNVLKELDEKYGENTVIVFHINYVLYNIKEIRIATVRQIKSLIDKGQARIRYGKAIDKDMVSLDKRSCKLLKEPEKKYVQAHKIVV